MKTSANPRFGAWLIAAFALLSAALACADTHAETSPAADAPTVLITGANRGLGLEFARQFAAAGWQVIGTARKPDKAVELQALEVTVMTLDVADTANVEALAAALDGRAIDLLINNAGIFPRVNSINEINLDDYNRTLAVNTLGPVIVTRALLPNLRLGGKKMIINISSRLGSIELNQSGTFYGYRESKAALNMFTKTLANELQSEGFICAVIHPGWVQTDMGGKNANLTPEESISGMRAVIDKLGPDDNGSYWSYSGEQVPW